MGADTRERLATAAADLLMRQGFHGTSLGDLLAASDAPRGSLYFHYPGGKEEILLAGLRRLVAAMNTLITDSFGAHADPARGTRAWFRAVAHWMRETDYGFGCPVTAVVADGMTAGSPLAKECKAALVTWRTLVENAYIDRGIAPRRANALSMLALAAEEGGILIARATRDAQAIERAGAEVARLVAAESRD